MIEEESFVQTARRARFLAKLLGVAPDDFLDSAEPLIKPHRFRVLLDCYSWQPDLVQRAQEEVRSETFGGIWQLYENQLAPVRNERNDLLSALVNGGIDDTATGLTRRVLADHDLALRLLKISPESPLAKGLLVAHETSLADANLAQWEQAGREHPFLIHELAARHENRQQLNDAERCWKLAADADSSIDSMELLANFYRRRGNDVIWLSTLDKALTLPDFGLDHARIRVTLAKHFRAQRNWKQAVPYAAAAADSYAGWAMQEAILAYEGAQDWEAVDKWREALYDRYQTGAWAWYLFNKRTGKGDVNASRRLIRPLVVEFKEQLTADNAHNAAQYFLLEYDLQQAAAALELVMGTNATASAGLMLALTYVELKDVAKRDSALAKVHSIWNLVNPKEGPGTRIIALGDAIAADLAAAKQSGGKAGFATFDKRALDQMYQQAADEEKVWFDYLAGRYCALLDNKPLAVEFWKRCMASPYIDEVGRTLAGAGLVNLGIGPDDYKAALHAEAQNSNPAANSP